jgi:hypothetical protein
LKSDCIFIIFDGVIPSAAVFQAERGIWRGGILAVRARLPSTSLRPGSRPAGENAGLRNDAAKEDKIQIDTLPRSFPCLAKPAKPFDSAQGRLWAPPLIFH